MVVAVDPLPAEACHRFARVSRASTVWVCPAPAPPVVVTPVATIPPVVVTPVAAAPSRMPPPVTSLPPAPTVDPKLAAHLAAWEKQRKGMTNVHAILEVTRRESVFKREKRYTGSVLHMRPDFTRLRLDNVADPTKADYEAYIRNGKVLYEYNGLKKTISEFQIADNKNDRADPKTDEKIEPVDPASWWGQFLARMFSVFLSAELMPMTALSQISAKEYLERYQITLFKEDEFYLYLDLRPKSAADRQEFEQIQIALLGPNVKPPNTPYAPAQLYILKPNGDSETWTFKKTQWNVPGVSENAFQLVEIPGWQLKSMPPKKAEAEQPPEEIKSVEPSGRLMDTPPPILPAVDPPPPGNDKPRK
jgi:TIGR03009 family protein